MKINREEFLKVLTAVKPGLAKKEIIDHSTNFIFTGQEVLTYNDQICISYPLKTGIKCSVPAQDFYKVISNMELGDFDLSLEGEKLLLNGKKSRSGHTSVSALGNIEELIKALKLNSITRKWIPLPDDFIKGMRMCMFSVSQDQVFGALSCVFVDKDKILSSDNNRISEYKFKKGLKESFLIRGSSVLELVNFPVSSFCLADSWIYFKTKDGVIFTSRRTQGDFPDVSSFMTLKGMKIVFPSELKKLVQDVSVMAPGEFDIDKKITITIDKGKLTCRGEKDRGWIEKDLTLEDYKGKDISFLVNPILFDEVLDKSTSVVLGEDRALFISGSFTHLMSLPTK